MPPAAKKSSYRFTFGPWNISTGADPFGPAVRKEVGKDATLLYVTRYQRARMMAQRARHLPNPRERFVAVIYATGPIKGGRSTRSPLGGSSMGSTSSGPSLRTLLTRSRTGSMRSRISSDGSNRATSSAGSDSPGSSHRSHEASGTTTGIRSWSHLSWSFGPVVTIVNVRTTRSAARSSPSAVSSTRSPG